MKKFILLLAIFLPSLCFSQMKYSKGVYNGLAYAYWDGPGDDIVVVLQGSGEFSTAADGSDVDRFINKNSYAQYAATKTFPFDILVAASYKGPKDNFPSQYKIMTELSNLLSTIPHDKTVLTGYSYGGQGTVGFATESRNGSNATLYKGANVFDAFVVFCGQAPGTPDWEAAKDKPMMLVHGLLDNDVKPLLGEQIVNNRNKVNPKNKLYANYQSKWIAGGTMVWEPKAVPDTALCKAIFIPTGSHYTSWSKGYNINDDVGKQVYAFILKVFEDKPVETKPIACTVLLDTIKMQAQFLLPSGKVYKATITKQ